MEDKPLRKCRNCGLEAWSTEDLTKFKSNPKALYGKENQCRKCATERSHGNKPHASMKRIICVNCKTPFESKWGHARYCSKKCSAAYHSNKKSDLESERVAQEKLKLRLAELDAPECDHICIDDSKRCTLKKGHDGGHSHKQTASILNHVWQNGDIHDKILPPPEKTTCAIHNDLTLDDLDAIQIRIAVEGATMQHKLARASKEPYHGSRMLRSGLIVDDLVGADRRLVTISNGYPKCKLHGAMNQVSADGLWRCISTQSLKRSEDICRAGCVIREASH